MLRRTPWRLEHVEPEKEGNGYAAQLRLERSCGAATNKRAYHRFASELRWH